MKKMIGAHRVLDQLALDLPDELLALGPGRALGRLPVDQRIDLGLQPV